MAETDSVNIYETEALGIEDTSITAGEVEYHQVVSLLLGISREEYSKERELTNSLDNKSGIFISAILALMVLYIPIIPFAAIKQIYQGTEKASIIATTVCILILVVAFAFLILSFLNLSEAISLKEFKRVDYENLNDEKILSEQAKFVERGLLDHYNTILEDNAKINDNKAKELNKGLKKSVIAFVLLIVAAIGLLIIAG